MHTSGHNAQVLDQLRQFTFWSTANVIALKLYTDKIEQTEVPRT